MRSIALQKLILCFLMSLVCMCQGQTVSDLWNALSTSETKPAEIDCSHLTYCSTSFQTPSEAVKVVERFAKAHELLNSEQASETPDQKSWVVVIGNVMYLIVSGKTSDGYFIAIVEGEK